MIGIFAYLTLAALFFAPVLLFWLWMGASMAFFAAWIRGLFAMWTWPLMLPIMFLIGLAFVAVLLLNPTGLSSWAAFSLLALWVLPIALGIWAAKRYPLQRDVRRHR